MCAVCVYIPTVTVNGKKQDSKFFNDLLKFYGDRESAKQVYYFATTPTFLSKVDSLGIELDEAGEPVFKSLKDALNLQTSTDSLFGSKLDLNAIDKDGNIIYYKNTAGIINDVIDYNENHKLSVAMIKKNDSGYYIDVVKFSPETFDVQSRLVRANETFKRLLSKLNALGFTVGINSDLVEHGMFDPMNAEETTEGLLKIIQISDGELGAAALPEELAHTFIEGLKNTPIGSRLINMISEHDITKEILGREYSKYAKYYDNDSAMLIREAAAKLLMDGFSGKDTLQISDRPWYNRIMDRVRSIIDRILNIFKGKRKYIMEARDEAKKLAEGLYGSDYNADISIEEIKLSPRFYKVINNVADMRMKLKKGIELLTKDFNIKREKAFVFSENKDLRAYQDEILSVKNLLDSYDKKPDYRILASGLLKYIEIAGKVMEKSFKNLKIGSLDTLENISVAASAYNNILQYQNSFLEQLKQIRAFSKIEAKIIDPEMPQAIMNSISNAAGEIVKEFEDSLRNIRTIKYKIAKSMFAITLGLDPEKPIYTRKDKHGKLHAVTLDMLLQESEKDLNRLDAWIVSFADTSDALFSIISLVIRNQKNGGDDFVRKNIMPRIIAANTTLRLAGVTDTSFMYEKVKLKNRNGKEYYVTHIISDIDWVKYNTALNAEFDRIDALKASKAKKRALKRKWLMENNDVNEANHEYTPLLRKYAKKNGEKVKDVLSEAEYEYYDEMMRPAPQKEGDKPEGLKRLIEDTMLPEGKRKLYRPIYLRDDLIEAISVKNKPAKTIVKNGLDNIEDKFVRRVDEDEFGNQVALYKTNLDGTIRETLPLMYVTPLENSDRLSMDFTQAMIAYAVTSVQYAAMEEIVDSLELLRNIMKERAVLQTKGNIRLRKAVSMVGGQKVLENIGLDYSQQPSRMMEAFNNFYANVVYGRRKEDEGTIQFGHNFNLDVAKMEDFLRAFTTQAGLGLNPFSGISNLTMGKFQFFIESLAREFFNMKNAAVAEKQYAQYIPGYLAELTSTNKMNTMSLFIDMFDALDSYREDLKRRGYYNSLAGRIFGNDITLLFQTAGEHRLHVLTMFAILDNIKVKRIDPKTKKYVKDSSGKDKLEPLFNAFGKVITRNEEGTPLSAYLDVKEGYVLESGRPITAEYLNKVKNLIHEANGRMHGKFNADDRGNLNRWGVGRLMLQFRQWMVTHYRRRFEKTKYNAILDYDVEGFYFTTYKLMGELYSTIKKGEFAFGAMWHGFSKHQQANLRRALFEIASFIGLSAAITYSAKPKDLKGKWRQRMLLYAAMRLRTEIGASTPSLGMFENIMTLLQSPAASLSKMNALVDLLSFWDLGVEIESGRYAGMSVWRRNLYEAMPYIGQIRKTFDLSEEDYMFNVFNNMSTKFRRQFGGR